MGDRAGVTLGSDSRGVVGLTSVPVGAWLGLVGLFVSLGVSMVLTGSSMGTVVLLVSCCGDLVSLLVLGMGSAVVGVGVGV